MKTLKAIFIAASLAALGSSSAMAGIAGTLSLKASTFTTDLVPPITLLKLNSLAGHQFRHGGLRFTVVRFFCGRRGMLRVKVRPSYHRFRSGTRISHLGTPAIMFAVDRHGGGWKCANLRHGI